MGAGAEIRLCGAEVNMFLCPRGPQCLVTCKFPSASFSPLHCPRRPAPFNREASVPGTKTQTIVFVSSGGQSLGKEQVETEMKGRRKGEKPCKKMPVVGHGRVPAGISGMPGSYSPYLIFNPNKRYYSSPNLFLTGVCGWSVCFGFG